MTSAYISVMWHPGIGLDAFPIERGLFLGKTALDNGWMALTEVIGSKG